jgi:CBS-domain-containing membrane protein
VSGKCKRPVETAGHTSFSPAYETFFRACISGKTNMPDDSMISPNSIPEISDSDIYEAMEEIPGYLDITPEDFREIYRHAFQHAYQKQVAGRYALKAEADSIGQLDMVGGACVSATEALKNYFRKMRGPDRSPPAPGLSEVCWSWLGAFLGIAAVAALHYSLVGQGGLVLLVGSFGASAVLIYGAVRSPLAQPRNLIGGHMLSALIGVAAYQLLPGCLWLASAAAVATAIAVMQCTKTLHPPGGATALIAVIGGDSIHTLGYLYAVIPVGLGALLMLIVALLVNNIPRSRQYPEFWW